MPSACFLSLRAHGLGLHGVCSLTSSRPLSAAALETTPQPFASGSWGSASLHWPLTCFQPDLRSGHPVDSKKTCSTLMCQTTTTDSSTSDPFWIQSHLLQPSIPLVHSAGGADVAHWLQNEIPVSPSYLCTSSSTPLARFRSFQSVGYYVNWSDGW